ncbi:hypothetical protein ACQPW3_34920 [Actinosynnema sp. CA-248983]
MKPAKTPEATDRPFTPRLEHGKRLVLKLNAVDESKMSRFGRRLGYRGTITDQTTGKRYEVYGAACNSPDCICDAIVYPLDHPSRLTRSAKVRLTEIEARQVELYTELDDLPDNSMALRREIEAALDGLASEEVGIQGAAA